MRCIFLIIISFIFCVSLAEAQNLKFTLQSGYGFYNMRSFSQITSDVHSQLSFDSKIISNYPPYLYYQPMIVVSNKNFDMGLLYLYQTTGSRISSKDYSGEYLFDSKIVSQCPGVYLSPRIYQDKLFNVSLFLQGGANFSTISYTEFLKIDTVSNNSTDKFRAISFYLEPGLNFTIPWKRFDFGMHLGYFKEFSRDDYEKVGESQIHIDVNKKLMNPDVWDGLRIGATISYYLFKQKQIP